MPDGSYRQGTAIKAGLIVGSIAGVVAALVSLPLNSPHDGLLNTGSVVLAVLATGGVAAQVWRVLPIDRMRLWMFLALSSATFGIVSAFAVIADSQIDRVVSFIMPLAAIAIAITATGIVFLARQERLLRWWVVVPVVIVALAVGAGLAGKGDQESGRLELRPRSTTIEASTIPSFNI
jgi:hypothetical protein